MLRRLCKLHLRTEETSCGYLSRKPAFKFFPVCAQGGSCRESCAVSQSSIGFAERLKQKRR